MQTTLVRSRIVKQIQHMAGSAVIKDRRFLDDEQLIRSEQMPCWRRFSMPMSVKKKLRN